MAKSRTPTNVRYRWANEEGEVMKKLGDVFPGFIAHRFMTPAHQRAAKRLVAKGLVKRWQSGFNQNRVSYTLMPAKLFEVDDGNNR